MAQLKNTVVSGSLRATDSLLSITAQFKILNAPTTSNSLTYGPGTQGQILRSNGTTIYWDSVLDTGHGGTGVDSHTANRLVWSTSATTIQAGDNHYVNTTKVGINLTSEPSYNFYVNGTSYLNDNARINGNLYFEADKDIYFNYNSIDWPILDNANNGNVSLNACGENLLLGYNKTSHICMYYTNSDNSTRTEFFEINDNGAYALTRFGVNGQNTSYNLYVNGTSYFNGAMTVAGNILPAANNTYALGSSSDEWGTTYTRQIYARHFDASANYTDDRNMYYGYNSGNIHYFYSHDGTTRTQRAYIGATGLVINQPAANRNAGIIGTYDYTKAALIWSMGTSYNVAVDGSGLGNLYGAAYGYQGQTYLGSKNYAGGHQFIWCNNGSPQVALGSNGIWIKKGGGLYWDPYVESESDASDVTSIYQITSGVAGGTELRINQQNDATDVINLCTNSHIYMNSKKAFTINDSWLRINEDKGFSSGIYTGSSLIRTDNQLQVGSSGSKFYANSSGNTYCSSHAYSDGNMYAHGIWANRVDGEKQVGVDNGTAGKLYLWSNNSEKGLYSGSGYQTGYIIRVTSNRVYFADAYTRTNTALAYSQSALGYDAYTYLAGWNGYELRAI